MSLGTVSYNNEIYNLDYMTEEELENLLKIIENDKFSNQAEYKKSNSYESAGNITFIKEQGEESSKQFNVVTTARHDKNTGRTYADATLKNGELDLFKASYINSRRYLCYKM